jgi:hypothetical protein
MEMSGSTLAAGDTHREADIAPYRRIPQFIAGKPEGGVAGAHPIRLTWADVHHRRWSCLLSQ